MKASHYACLGSDSVGGLFQGPKAIMAQYNRWQHIIYRKIRVYHRAIIPKIPVCPTKMVFVGHCLELIIDIPSSTIKYSKHHQVPIDSWTSSFGFRGMYGKVSTVMPSLQLGPISTEGIPHKESIFLQRISYLPEMDCWGSTPQIQATKTT